jgi:hypothetical protein
MRIIKENDCLIIRHDPITKDHFYVTNKKHNYDSLNFFVEKIERPHITDCIEINNVIIKDIKRVCKIESDVFSFIRDIFNQELEDKNLDKLSEEECKLLKRMI